MFLNTILKPPSLAGRLTVWYTLVSTSLFLIAIAVVYLLTASALLEQVDDDLEEDIEDFNAIYRTQGIDALWGQIAQEAELDGSGQILFRLYDNSGEQLRSTDDGSWSELTFSLAFLEQVQEDGEPLLMTNQLETQEYPARTAYGLLGEGSDRYLLQISESLEERADVLEIFSVTFLASLPVLIGLSLLAGWLMARKSLSGVQQVTDAAIDISNGAFDERVPQADQGIEIDRLADTFNQMLDKIQILIRGMREMNDNIAHDLKSPLARIRGIAETTLTGDQGEDQYQHLAASTIEECDRLLHLINTMLDLAETEAGLSKSMERIDLAALIDDASDLYQPLAGEKSITLKCQIDAPIFINGNRQFLQRMIGNLLDNAVKYTPENGAVTISSEIVDDNVLVKVMDTGVGIQQQDLDHIFQRFYRADQSRSKPGTGLGLALVQAIAKAHRGTISVHSKLAEGSQFIVRFPLAHNI